jgi:hypothetical protein
MSVEEKGHLAVILQDDIAWPHICLSVYGDDCEEWLGFPPPQPTPESGPSPFKLLCVGVGKDQICNASIMYLMRWSGVNTVHISDRHFAFACLYLYLIVKLTCSWLLEWPSCMYACMNLCMHAGMPFLFLYF